MGAPARIFRAFLAEEIEIIASEPLLEELREVLQRPRFSRKYGITRRDVNSYVELIGERATVVEITGQALGCTDPDDDMFVETAILGKAHTVVSGDPDLTEDETIIGLLHEHGVAVLDPRRLIEALWPG
jgi:uncharacterized protein